MKIDALNDFFVKEVTFSSATVHTICEHKFTAKIKLYAWGHNTYGQLGLENLETVKHEPYDMTPLFVETSSI